MKWYALICGPLAGSFAVQQVRALGVASSRSKFFEFRSSGRLVERGRGTPDFLDAKTQDDSDSVQWFQHWPKDAVSRTEQVLPWPEGANSPKVRAGGTRPEKVLFPREGVFVRKTVPVSDSSAVMMEALVDNLYAVAGVVAPQCQYYPDNAKVTKAYILCQWIDGAKPVYEMDKPMLYHASAHFVLDAIFANYDLWGRRGNMAQDKVGTMIRLDNGGSLASNNLGGWKRTVYDCNAPLSERREAWSREPFSLWDMRSSGSELYAHVTMHDIHGEAISILRKKALFLKAIDDFNSTIATKKVKRTLEARLDCLSRIIRQNVDLLGQVSQTDTTLSKEVCEGVRSLCHDLLVDYL